MKVYVRTKDGYIGEIVEVGKYTLTMSINDVIRYVDIDNVKKTLPLILELLEVGDYVNGEKITRVIPEDVCGDEVLDYQHIFIGDKEIYKEDIKSIVTKEQFAKGEFIL